MNITEYIAANAPITNYPDFLPQHANFLGISPTFQLIFLVGIVAVIILSIECVESIYAYIIAILALFTGSKARKKEAPKA